ncbi:hypothetical protein IFM89_025854, partial [Coptis chinensis]
GVIAADIIGLLVRLLQTTEFDIKKKAAWALSNATSGGDHNQIKILRLLTSLKVVSVLPPPDRDPTPLSLLPFGRLKVLELRGCDLSTSPAKGLLQLRHTLEKLILHNSTLLMDDSLQLLPNVESRNRFGKGDNLKKCTKLSYLDLGFNHLRSISSLSEVACSIVKLVLRNNALTSLNGIETLKSIEGLDLSYNVISNVSELEILASLPFLQSLWLEGNPICCAPCPKRYEKCGGGYTTPPYNLEEEFMQLSVESYSLASSDSDTSNSDDEYCRFDTSLHEVDHSPKEPRVAQWMTTREMFPSEDTFSMGDMPHHI